MSPRRQGAVQARRTPPPRGGLSRRTRRRLAIALILVLIGVAASWGYARWGARPSEMAPAFALPASTGRDGPIEGVPSLVLWLGLLAFVAIGVVAGIRWLASSGSRVGSGRAADGALEILRERYARGEIGPEEFQRRRRDLSRGVGS